MRRGLRALFRQLVPHLREELRSGYKIPTSDRPLRRMICTQASRQRASSGCSHPWVRNLRSRSFRVPARRPVPVLRARRKGSAILARDPRSRQLVGSGMVSLGGVTAVVALESAAAQAVDLASMQPTVAMAVEPIVLLTRVLTVETSPARAAASALMKVRTESAAQTLDSAQAALALVPQVRRATRWGLR